MTRFLVTGAAGFIGFHLSRALIGRGDEVVGVDNINDYYDPALKQARLALLRDLKGFSFERIDLSDRSLSADLFARTGADVVVHLAAQAGVRYSLDHPHAYLEANLAGFLNVLEGCRHNGVKHLVYASSSSVYGANTSMPFSVHDNVDHPVSLYAATKKANELMAHSYSHLYGLPVTGLRFFTVYGPWGRPDMAIFIFTRAILAGQPIDVYNNGDMERAFTYIDDIVEGVIRTADRIPRGDASWNSDKPDPASSRAPYRLYNIGNNTPENLSRMIDILERIIGRKAPRNLLPIQPGDVRATCASTADLERDTGFRPSTPIEEGLSRFVAWYREYHDAARG